MGIIDIDGVRGTEGVGLIGWLMYDIHIQQAACDSFADCQLLIVYSHLHRAGSTLYVYAFGPHIQQDSVSAADSHTANPKGSGFQTLSKNRCPIEPR